MDDDTTTGPPAETTAAPQPTEPVEALRRDAILIRARCSNLRHWCAAMLADPGVVGALDAATVAYLRGLSPEVSEAEGQTVVALLARGGSVPPTHPLAYTTNDPVVLRAAIVSLTGAHERLRQAFFALYDRLYPGDNLTDEFFLAQQWDEVSISDLIAEMEREAGAKL